MEMSDPGPTVLVGVSPAAFLMPFSEMKGNPSRTATAKRGAFITSDAVRLVPDRSPDQCLKVNPLLGRSGYGDLRSIGEESVRGRPGRIRSHMVGRLRAGGEFIERLIGGDENLRMIANGDLERIGGVPPFQERKS